MPPLQGICGKIDYDRLLEIGPLRATRRRRIVNRNGYGEQARDRRLLGLYRCGYPRVRRELRMLALLMELAFPHSNLNKGDTNAADSNVTQLLHWPYSVDTPQITRSHTLH
ncbi:MAG: hypothetical protein KDB27_25985 [Planctomycetales bacterium]|nr:hypothetical protein [Planctomycetales bacterium]